MAADMPAGISPNRPAGRGARETPTPCPCGSRQTLDRCCGPIIAGSAPALTALALMRSRYVAYVVRNAGYLTQTWHDKSRPATLRLDPRQKWLGLSIKSTVAGEASDSSGTVEFVARYRLAGKAYRLHEVSRFVRVDGLWVYLDGKRV